MSYLATDSLFPEWSIWTQFHGQTTSGLRLDALAESHPIEVKFFGCISIYPEKNAFDCLFLKIIVLPKILEQYNWVITLCY